MVLCGINTSGLWALPKGTPQKGEKMEETAVREVREETGLTVRIVDKIGNIEYWFVDKEEGCRYFKRVSHYLMEPTGGDMADHDPEFDEVRWFDLEEALEALTYRNEAGVVRQAAALILEGTEAQANVHS